MQGYVIGTNELHLLKIKGHSVWEIMCGANAEEPAEVESTWKFIGKNQKGNEELNEKFKGE